MTAEDYASVYGTLSYAVPGLMLVAAAILFWIFRRR